MEQTDATQDATSSVNHRVHIFNSLREMTSLEATWKATQQSGVDSDFNYFACVVEVSPNVRNPHVFSAERGDHNVILVARVTEENLSLGFLTAPLTTLVVSFDGLLGVRTAQDLPHMREALLNSLDAGAASAAVLQKVDTASEWFHCLHQLPARRRLVRAPEDHWQTDIPESWEDLLGRRSKKTRKRLRYEDSRLRKKYGAELILRRLHESNNHPRIGEDIKTVAAASYQSRLGVSLVNDEVQTSLLERARVEGWLRVWMLYIQDRPVAFWWGIVRNATLSVGTPGFVADMANDHVGHYTLRRMLEDACDDPEVQLVDWGPGHSEYKEQFGTSRRSVADVVIARDNLSGWLLIAAFRLKSVAGSTVRSAARQLRLGRTHKRLLTAMSRRR